MKHDFAKPSDGFEAENFISWLQDETISALQSSHRNLESLKTTLFLYTNRAYESHLEEDRIYNILAVSIVRAGYTEEETSPLFDIFESFAQIARVVNGYI